MNTTTAPTVWQADSVEPAPIFTSRPQELTMARIERFIRERVIVDSADLARIAALCMSRLESEAARAQGQPFLRAKVERVSLQHGGTLALQVRCGDVGFTVAWRPEIGDEPLIQGDSVRLEYEKGASPLAGNFTRVSRDWVAA